MILTSSSDDDDQASPVTTTFDPPDGTRVAVLPRGVHSVLVDWGRVERLYAFVRARSSDRLIEAEQRRDLSAMHSERRSIHAADAMFSQARQGEGVLLGCAITFFRARAMRDAHHPEFRGEWLAAPDVRGTTVVPSTRETPA